MGVSAKTSASRDRFDQNNWANNNQNTTTNSNTNTTQNTSSSGNSSSLLNTNQKGVTSNDATFNSPQGQAILNALTGAVTNSSGANQINEAGGIYSRLGAGGVNPYTEGIIKSGDVEANKNFASRLAGVRAGAYRGGTAANIGQQGQLAADFTAQQAGNNAKLRSDAFNEGNTLALAGASGLGSLGTQQGSLATQILSLLRGSTGTSNVTGQEAGSTSTNQIGQSNTQSTQQIVEQLIAALTGGQSGTKSSTSGSAGAGFGLNYG